MLIWRLAILISLCNTAFAQSVQVIPSDLFETTITTDTNGHITVDIAQPVSDGVSHNRFTRFNVPEAGLDFDNRVVNARTIISEVTGSERSLIEGPVEILGQRAHLIIANQNGITVDGGRFINTGGLALSTGALGFIDRVPAPFRTQKNTTLSVSQGEIIIGPGGLSGAMDTLYFLSKHLRVDGAVTNENPSPFAGIEIFTGDSETEIDSSLLPLNDLSLWATTEAGDAAGEGFLIDITERGALNGSQITALVTDAGAGVRHAGSVLADRGDFTLTAEGEILIEGGEAVAARDIIINAHAITATSGASASLPRPIMPDVIDPIPQLGPDGFADINPGLIISGGANGDTEAEEDYRAIFNAANGAVRLMASTGDIDLTNSVISANDAIEVVTPTAFRGESTQMFSGGTIDITAPEITVLSDFDRSFLAAQDLLSLNATEGSIILDGARLQGSIGTDDEDTEEVDNQAVMLNAAGDIVLRSVSEDYLGVIFGVDGDVVLNADGRIVNHTSRIIANGDVEIHAGLNFDNIIALPNGDRDPSLVVGNQEGDLIWWTAFSRRLSSRSFVMEFGELDLGGQLAFVTATGSVSIEAGGDIINLGGEINANDGDINLTAQNVITEGVISGTTMYRRRCSLFCSSSGSSNISVSGGQISAAGVLNITAENLIQNRGGFLTGIEGINLAAKQVEFMSHYLPQIVDRPSGLYNLWSGHSAWIYWRDTLGGTFAGDASVVITGAESIRLSGVEIDNIISSVEVDRLYGPRQSITAHDQTIGVLAGLAPIIGN